ncbi:YqaA family protein [Thiovibrio frasassiensis]|uniref:DedA family protein n=1 Tax=Thiovibrio frasassiensis TaxID=2984131 RepID=A0A9X4RQB4_9BACT|nr:YqaA family protein [Thiovibrio frasassiensis]MDG4476107.1 DedA family protein [Thiovibrio frasassiensis]
MDIFFNHQGYLALFLLSFLASTLVPLGSEWLLVALLLNGHPLVLSVGVATAGNTLGACATHGIGLYGGSFLLGRVLRVSESARLRAERIFARYGSWSLFFSWLPIIGDPLCLVSGILKVRFGFFFALVLSGKLLRYLCVGLLTLQAVS